MTKAEVLEFLKAERDPRGTAHGGKHPEDSDGLKSYGIGLTRLRKYAKTLGRDAELAARLWKSKIYEAKVISLLVDDPRAMTIEQAEAQVEQLAGGRLAHVYASCGAPLAKTSFVLELLEDWVVSEDPIRRRCGHDLLYEVSKWKKKTAPDEAAFLAHVERIEKTYAEQPVQVLLSMGGALMGIGKRSKRLNAAALRVAEEIGPIDFDPDGKCDPFDVAKHLSSAYVKEKLDL